MNTAERRAVRQSIINKGFARTGHTSDVSGSGEYTETWAHADGSVISLTWGPKTPEPAVPGPLCNCSGQDEYHFPECALNEAR